ncbi:DUF418 domain-containing protein [Streptomyces sp. 549]|uniref:DUF418 domain-containing protein n=1 Tax=Streptomyces sp. 549 TaxID=3049076 RepID=UPI0024C317D5|nr:DUF418 domain-containing protein [Streptomyces sp. 549]MDK1475215.1 DUF418 domain-containing protein [Streptomyces sp. 549]
MTAAAAASPTAEPAPRVHQADALRGFALFGILVVNIGYFASGYTAHGVSDPAFGGPVDQAAETVVSLLFSMKFYLLFSFLFGYSFTLQTASAQRAGRRLGPRHLRRLAGLFVLGAAHAVLLYHGDILATYAVLGLLLYLLRGVSNRTALVLAACLIGWVVLLFAALAAVVPVEGGDGAALRAGQETAQALAGGPGSVIAAHLDLLPGMVLALVLQQAPTAMAMFLLGLVAGRMRLLADDGTHAVRLRRVQWVGFPLGLAGAVCYVLLDSTSHVLAGLAVSTLTAPLLSAAYAATLLRFFRTGPGHRLQGALAPAGRMALTNYLAQSLVCVLLFTGVGAGLVGSVSPALTLAVAVAVFGCQLLVSRWWLARHRYGPTEWALRAFSYLELPGRAARSTGERA